MALKFLGTQQDQVLKHLRRTGSITPVEAWDTYGVRQLPYTIHSLRNSGHEIVSQIKSHPVTRQRYTRYHLVEPIATRAS